MKIRSDFVTNSSSSSFIVGFKDENNIENELKGMMNPKDKVEYDTLLNDIKKCRVTKAKAKFIFLEEGVDWWTETALQTKYERQKGYREFRDYLKVFENKEKFQQELYDEFMKKFDEFKKKLEEFEYIAEVNYSDHDNCMLEHEILPTIPCTIQRFSHH